MNNDTHGTNGYCTTLCRTSGGSSHRKNLFTGFVIQHVIMINKLAKPVLLNVHVALFVTLA